MFAFSINVSFKSLVVFYCNFSTSWDKRIQWYATWIPFIPYKDEAFFIK